jgi:hypothetical protein
MDLLFAFVIVIAIILMVWWLRGRENFINYYGFDDNILDKVCPSPWCGSGPVIRVPEDSMYPFMMAGDDVARDKAATDKAIEKMREINSEAHQVARMAGYDLEDDYLVNPSNNVKEVLAAWDAKETGAKTKDGKIERFDGGGITGDEMYALYEDNVLGPGRFGDDGGDGLSSYPAGFTGYGSIGNGYTGGFVDGNEFTDSFVGTMKYGTHRSPPPPSPPREGFEAQQNVADYSYAARQVYEHPDMDNFNRTYYSNPSRTLGIAPQRQAVMHFNEGVGYYARPQEMLAPTEAAVPNVDARVSYGRASDFFDLPESFDGATIEDPREAVTMPNGLYKGRRDVNDVLDTEMRRRNQITLDAGQRGGRYSNKARGILSVVFSPEMYDATQNVWWESYEA